MASKRTAGGNQYGLDLFTAFTSRLAIANTLGTIFFLSVGTLICIYLIIINGGSFANQWISFIAFLVLGIGGLLYVLSADRPSPASGPATARQPPSRAGLHTWASLRAGQGGKASPSGCGRKPVALHTALISMPDLVPSMKLLNIFGFIRPRSAFSLDRPKCSQTVSGVLRWKEGW